MNEQKIAEIVHEAIFKVTGCKDLKADGMYLSKELEQAILALIEQEQAKHNTTRWYTAKKHYDEGTETQEDRDILSGAIDTLDCQECMKQAKDFAWEAGLTLGIKAEREKYKPMVEALKGIEERARLAKGKATGERPLKSATEACAWIAKEAHAVLPKGEGK